MKKHELISWLRRQPGNPEIIILLPRSEEWGRLRLSNATVKKVRTTRIALRSKLDRKAERENQPRLNDDEFNEALPKTGWEFLDGNKHDDEAILEQKYLVIPVSAPSKYIVPGKPSPCLLKKR